MKILAVSLAYPPLAYPRSVQVARLLKHSNSETTLFCADEPGTRLDPTIEPDAESGLAACIRVPVRRSKADILIGRAAYRFARGVWNKRNLAPDAYGKWRSDVLKSIEDHLSDHSFSPDVIVTFAQPFSDHLIGLELKKQFGLPWLAHFSDPWVDNPFSRLDQASLKLNLALERSVTERADVLAFTSAETVDLYFAKYPERLKSKARVLPQCFGEIAGIEAEKGNEHDLIVRYLGNFYGHRTPAPLIRSLLDIHNSTPALIDQVRFELIGPGDADEARRMSRDLPAGLLRIIPSVNYEESVKLMRSADGLIVIDAPAVKSVFLPSKLIDYIGAARPVLAITPEGTASTLVRELGGFVADPAHPDRIIDAIRSFLNLLQMRRRSGSSTDWGDPSVRQRFTPQKIAADFSGILAEIVK